MYQKAQREAEKGNSSERAASHYCKIRGRPGSIDAREESLLEGERRTSKKRVMEQIYYLLVVGGGLVLKLYFKCKRQEIQPRWSFV